jgi:hypothetical protein
VADVGVEVDVEALYAGIGLAMGLGLPADPDNRPIFVFRDQVTNTTPADEEQVPFDPWATPVVVAGNQLSDIVCAIEYTDQVGQVMDVGIVTPTRLKLTFRDPEYQLVRGFASVLIAGDRYLYRHTEPPVSLGEATFWFVHCTAEDDT